MSNPGKFEGCSDQRLGEVLYKVTLDGGCSEELGECDGFGWYGFIISRNKKTGYIVSEDSDGFFDYVAYPMHRAKMVWKELEKDYAEYCVDVDAENVEDEVDS